MSLICSKASLSNHASQKEEVQQAPATSSSTTASKLSVTATGNIGTISSNTKHGSPSIANAPKSPSVYAPMQKAREKENGVTISAASTDNIICKSKDQNMSSASIITISKH